MKKNSLIFWTFLLMMINTRCIYAVEQSSEYQELTALHQRYDALRNDVLTNTDLSKTSSFADKLSDFDQEVSIWIGVHKKTIVDATGTEKEESLDDFLQRIQTLSGVNLGNIQKDVTIIKGRLHNWRLDNPRP